MRLGVFSRSTSIMRLDGMIFDLDGTLGDTLPVCFAAFRTTFQSCLGRDYSDQEIRAMFGPSEEGIFEQLMPGNAEEGLAMYLREYNRSHSRCQEPFPGIRTILLMLKSKGLRLAVVTGKGPRSAAISLDKIGLADLFDTVEAGSPEGGVKPACMRSVLAGWSIDPGRVACLGDAPSDIRSAQEVGAIALAAAWADTADRHALEVLNPHETFRATGEFARWVTGSVEG